MKKYAILALAAFMVVAFALPSYALENEFGGFWDTRFQSKKYYDGLANDDPGGVDDTEDNVETRTRLYYTAKINDNLKLVNKFEMDATWGAAGTYGRTGADFISIEVKNTYADFNVGPTNWTVGAQNFELFRGYYISSDASGFIGRWKAMDNLVLATSWLKSFEVASAAGAAGGDTETADVDSYTVSGAFWFSENMSIKPSINYVFSDDPSIFGVASGLLAPTTVDTGELNLYTMGVDFDMTFDNWGLWATGIWQGGEVEDVIDPTLFVGEEDIDAKGWLVAVGGNVMLGGFDIYGEFAYAAGSDDADERGFINPLGSHVWAELLADGTLWGGNPAGNAATGGGTYDVVTNLMYVGAGFKWSPMDKLMINPSVWYAKLDEDNASGDDTLGTEVDINIKYQLVEGMNLELIGAYLFADDAFVDGAIGQENEEDAYEYGMRLSLSF
jgi:hypothetical protein